MPIFNTISDNTIHKNQLLFMTWSDTDAPRGGVTNIQCFQRNVHHAAVSLFSQQ
jgi:hypothetical protein